MGTDRALSTFASIKGRTQRPMKANENLRAHEPSFGPRPFQSIPQMLATTNDTHGSRHVHTTHLSCLGHVNPPHMQVLGMDLTKSVTICNISIYTIYITIYS